MRTGPLAVAAWLVAAALVVAVSWSAVSVVRTAVAPAGLATDAGLPSALPIPDESATTAPPRSSSPEPSATAGGRAVSASGVGGTVVVRCVDGTPQLLNSTPRHGSQARVDDSPGEVRFTSGDHRTDIKTSCAGDTAGVEVKEKDESGNSGPGGGG